MSKASERKMELHCFGRFCVEAPAGARGGGTYEARWQTLTEEVLAPGDEGFDLAWAAEVGKAEEMQAETRSEPGDVSGEIHLNQEVRPAQLRYLSYYITSKKVGLRVVALGRSNGIALRATSWLGAEFEDRVRKDCLELAQAYAVRPEDGPWPVPGKDWFYLDHGSVALPFHEQEEASLHLENGELPGKLDFSTQTLTEVKSKGLLQRFMEAVVTAGAGFASGVSTMRSRGRAIGKFKGEELILRDSDAGTLQLLWRFEGRPNAPLAPEIKIAWETKDEDVKEKLALWDRILDSVRPASTP